MTEAAEGTETVDSFGRYLGVALFLHVSVAVLIFLRAIVMPSETLAIRDAIRVDVVDLPDKITSLTPPAPAAPSTPAKAPPPKAKPVEPVKTKPKPVAPTVDLKPKPDTAKAQREALNKLKALDALEKIKNDVSKEKTPPPAAHPIKGNAVAVGNSLTGLAKIAFDQYFDQLKAKVFANWSVPSWMADRELKATVVVLIDEQGLVTQKTIRHSSGNEIFDSKCLEAIDASSPFAPPPERLRGALSTSGINFNFPQ